MGTYDWMELQTLTNDIAAARSRLAAARATKDIGKARGLEEEIARAEAQRDRLLAHITTNLVAAPEPPRPSSEARPPGDATAEPTAEPDTAAAPPSGPAAAPDAMPVQTEATEVPIEAEAAPAADRPADRTPESAPESAADPILVEQHAPATRDRAVASGAAPPAPAFKAAGVEGGSTVWEQLKPSDIERAKQELAARRTEILARHAEELQALEGDQAQLDTLEQAIAAFLEKFSAPPAAGVVKLDAERELRQQNAV